jgi:hypothetical protein
VLQGASSDPFADGAFGDPEPTGGFLDGKTIYPASIPFVHTGDTRPLGPAPKALRIYPHASGEEKSRGGREMHRTNGARQGKLNSNPLRYALRQLEAILAPRPKEMGPGGQVAVTGARINSCRSRPPEGLQ